MAKKTVTPVEQPTNELVKLIDASLLEDQTKKTLRETFKTFYDQTEVWREKGMALVVTSVEEKDKMKEARDARIALKNIRVAADKERKAMKEEGLRKNDAIQKVYNFIESRIKPIEDHLKIQEEFEATENARKADELRKVRQEEIGPYSKYVIFPVFNSLGTLSDEEYRITFNGAKAQHDATIKAHQEAMSAAPVVNPEMIATPPERLIDIPGNSPSFNGRPVYGQAIYTPNPFGDALKSDKDKLLDLAKLIDNIAMPIVKDESGAGKIIVNVSGLLTKVTNYIKTQAEGLR